MMRTGTRELNLPGMRSDPEEELLRLMQGKPAEKQIEEGCHVKNNNQVGYADDDDMDDDYEDDEEDDENGIVLDGCCYDEYGRKFNKPGLYDREELLRLMKREPKRKPFEDEEDMPEYRRFCPVCGESGDDVHRPLSCPCLTKIPPGVELMSDFDAVCIGCGKIGEICCSKGAYAVWKECSACYERGHWFWEDLCPEGFVRPRWLLKILSLQNKKEDEVMADVQKDNKEEYEVMGDSGKQDAAKGRNDFSEQSGWEELPDGDNKKFMEHVMPANIYDEDLRLQISQKLTIDDEACVDPQFPFTTRDGLSWREDVNADKFVRSINSLST